MNKISPEFFIAKRYLNTQRKGLFTLITTFIGVAGVALGVAALIVTLSIMNGFQTDIRKRILDAQAHIVIYGNIHKSDFELIEKSLSEIKNVKSISPFFMGQAILSASDRTTGVIVKGIDIKKEFSVNNLKSSIRIGEWEALENKSGSVILGEQLANNLGLWINDDVILVSPKIQEAALGIIPKMKKFKMAGTFNTGYYEFDSGLAYCDIKDAAGFFGISDFATGVSVSIYEIKDVFNTASVIKEKLGYAYNVKTYADMNKNLFSALKLEKIMMSIVLALIIIVATFTITSNLLITSVEKIKDIGILRSMGASPSLIRKIFLYEGVLIAILGIAAGFVLGLSVSLLIKNYEFIKLPADIYYITKVPVKIELPDMIFTALVSFALCVLSAIFPAVRASKVNPIDAIRYG